MPDENDKERIDRELSELLEEIRVAIPGAEVLLAFLLGVAFTEQIHRATSLQRNVYFATLLCTAAAVALMIAPTAYHRLHFRAGEADKERMLFTSTKMALISLILVSVAISGVVFLVGDILYEMRFAALAGAGSALWFAFFWFVMPLARRRHIVSDDG